MTCGWIYSGTMLYRLYVYVIRDTKAGKRVGIIVYAVDMDMYA